MEQFEVEVKRAMDAMYRANTACAEYICGKIASIGIIGCVGITTSLDFNDTPFPVVQLPNHTTKIKGVDVVNNNVFVISDDGNEYNIMNCLNLTAYNVAMAVLYQLEYQKK
jgi:alpha-D-ribose 1-methylphosphonate 5-phosphate C-P lyase